MAGHPRRPPMLAPARAVASWAVRLRQAFHSKEAFLAYVRTEGNARGGHSWTNEDLKPSPPHMVNWRWYNFCLFWFGVGFGNWCVLYLRAWRMSPLLTSASRTQDTGIEYRRGWTYMVASDDRRMDSCICRWPLHGVQLQSRCQLSCWLPGHTSNMLWHVWSLLAGHHSWSMCHVVGLDSQ